MASVTLDPGKGGFKTGIIFENLVEKEINLNISLKCKEELLRHDIQVEITRETDEYVGYSQRIVKANKRRTDLFISIHGNSGGGSLAEIVYSVLDERSLRLATEIAYELKNNGASAIKIFNRIGHGNLDFNTVIREAIMDSVIINWGFIDNEYDRNLIDTKEKQEKMGSAIAKGILSYLEIEYIKP